MLGIDWDYHVDAVTYVEKSASVAAYILDSGQFLNNSYYLVVDALDSIPNNIICFNIFIYSLTNYVIAHLFSSSSLFRSRSLVSARLASFRFL